MPDDKRLKQELQKLRDELALKIHLASMETKEEWEKLEAKWQSFSTNAALDETAQNISSAVKLLGDEIKEGYRRLKKAL
jgi:hypothetical protein